MGRAKRSTATSQPHTVAVGNIQDRTTQVLVCGENAEVGLVVRGFARHLFCSGTDSAQNILTTACHRKVALFSLVEHGQYLVIAPTEEALEALLGYLSSQYVTAPRGEGRRARVSPGRECVLTRVEFVLSGGSVRPQATGAGGPQGKRYHALYARQEPTGAEQELQYGANEDNEGGYRHAGITGRYHVPGRKRGYGN